MKGSVVILVLAPFVIRSLTVKAAEQEGSGYLDINKRTLGSTNPLLDSTASDSTGQGEQDPSGYYVQSPYPQPPPPYPPQFIPIPVYRRSLDLEDQDELSGASKRASLLQSLFDLMRNRCHDAGDKGIYCPHPEGYGPPPEDQGLPPGESNLPTQPKSAVLPEQNDDQSVVGEQLPPMKRAPMYYPIAIPVPVPSYPAPKPPARKPPARKPPKRKPPASKPPLPSSAPPANPSKPGIPGFKPGPGFGSGFGPGNRPGFGAGNRPGLGPGGRPGFGPGNRPGFGTGNRPGFGTGNRPGFGSGNRPGFGSGNRPGFGSGNRPGKGGAFGNGGITEKWSRLKMSRDHFYYTS